MSKENIERNSGNNRRRAIQHFSTCSWVGRGTWHSRACGPWVISSAANEPLKFPHWIAMKLFFKQKRI